MRVPRTDASYRSIYSDALADQPTLGARRYNLTHL